MANNLRKFENEAAYSAATLNYPAVSWVTSGDTVHFDKEAPVTNDKIILYASASTEISEYDIFGTTFVLYNCGATSFATDVSALTVNDVAESDCEYTVSSYTVTAKYSLSGITTIGDWFSGVLGGDTYLNELEVLIPSQITVMGSMPDNMSNLVVLATTPPTLGQLLQSGMVVSAIYVPDESVNVYKTSEHWDSMSGLIHPISEYQGGLPV